MAHHHHNRMFPIKATHFVEDESSALAEMFYSYYPTICVIIMTAFLVGVGAYYTWIGARNSLRKQVLNPQDKEGKKLLAQGLLNGRALLEQKQAKLSSSQIGGSEAASSSSA